VRRRVRTRQLRTAGAARSTTSSPLYKLGWTLYKQQLYQEALPRFFALLDYKVKSGYDFDAKHTEAEAAAHRGYFQVVSLSFSNLGGPEVIGLVLRLQRTPSLRGPCLPLPRGVLPGEAPYQDAVTVYKSFVALYPFHEASPHFSNAGG